VHPRAAAWNSREVTADDVLDNPARSSLLGPHAHFAERRGGVLRYPSDVTAFLGLPDSPGPDDWDDVAALLGPGAQAIAFGLTEGPPGWQVTFRAPGVQMTGRDVTAEPDPEAMVLGPADVPEMLDLVSRAQPGPFLPRTIGMGTFLGIRRGGELVAMAGERTHPPGWSEISAVCTADDVRGQGLASRLVRAMTAEIRGRGEEPFLHATSTNVTAIRLYETLGFRLRRPTAFLAVVVPGRPAGRVRGPAGPGRDRS
jgi:ribosomal protein S18 acetylase RimI-like enzyme